MWWICMLIVAPPLILLTTTLPSVAALPACTTGCDCLPDPLVPSLILYSCRWSVPPPSNTAFNASSVRSIHIICESEFDLPATVFAGLSTLQSLKIERCRSPSLPASLFGDLVNLRSLHLHEVNPHGGSLSLSDVSLAPLSRLEKLSVTSSNLIQLPENIFCLLKNLQVMNVSSNAMTSLRISTSCQASQLIIVDLSRNQLKTIESDLHVFTAVRQLSLAHNRLISLHGAFDKSPLLQQLDLEDNELETLDGLPDTLIHVNMANNKLSVVPPSLARLPLLVSLNLSRNSVDQSSPAVIASTDLESLDLSYNRLSMLPSRLIPNAVNNLVHFNLENNQIAELKPMEMRNYSKLQTLNIRSNRLRILREDSFAGINELTFLNLANNSLDTVEPTVFPDSLDDLDLSLNKFTEVPMAVSKLYKLKTITLAHNKISKLYQYVFNRIPHLTMINLSHNEIESINAFVFSDSSHLVNLDLSNNKISILYKDSFVKCTALRRLNLSHNRIVSYDDALSQPFAVRHLDLSNNRLDLLKWDELPGKLEHLRADNNNIALLGAALRSKVRSASLKHNQISQLSADQLPATLETIDLTSNRIQYIAKGSFAGKSSIRRVDLTDNKLTSLEKDAVAVEESVRPLELTLRGNSLGCGCEMEWIAETNENTKIVIMNKENTTCTHAVDGRKILLSEIKNADLLCSYTKFCEPSCVCCQYGNCDCNSVCPAGCRCFRDALNSINIVRCQNLDPKQMKQFSPADVPVSATHVFLSGISLPILRSHSFLSRHRLQNLHINASGIQKIEHKAFNSLQSLKLLDLSDNSIPYLSGEEFHRTPALTHLFLNGNQMRTVERGLIEKLPGLEVMSLNNNHLIDISPSLSTAGISSLSLAGNPFRCDCTSMKYNAPEWMYANKDKVKDLERVLCVENVTKSFRENDTTVLSAYPPNVGHDIFTMPMNEFLRDYNRSICVPFTSGFFGQEPQNSILFVILIIACALLLLAMLLLAISLIRRTHNAMSQRRYKASPSLNCSSSTPGSSPLPVPLLNYDAFVSYSKKDEKMVVDQFCRPLEDEDFSLCLLHRDGPVYNLRLHVISDELISQMDSAQCLILILTKNFLENEWKTLQIKTSHLLFGKNRGKRIVAVMGDGVDQNLLDEELGQILRRNSCILMRDPLFWKKLHSALPVRLSPPPSESQIYSEAYGITPSEIV